MIASLVVTAILIFAGLFLFWQIYESLENETNKMLALVSYLLFVLVLVIHWFTKYIIEILTL